MIAHLRNILRPLLPERAFLRRSRGEGTFVTNAPRFSEGDLSPILTRAGFVCAERDSLLILSPGPLMLTQFEQEHPDPPDFLCQTLLRFRGQSPCEESLSAFAVGARLLESADGNEIRRYAQRVRQLAAICLRKNLGGAYGCALILNQILKGENL